MQPNDDLNAAERLAARLFSGDLSPDAAAAEARGLLAVSSAPETLPARLRKVVEATAWHAPGEAWALATLAHAYGAALGKGTDAAAEGALALALALSELGRYGEAIPLLDTARDIFLVHGRHDGVCRCDAELTLAYSFLGQFDRAAAYLARARDCPADQADALLGATCDRAEGQLHLEQNRYAEAAWLLQRAGDAFAAAGCDGQAAVAWCFLAAALRFTNPQAALAALEKVRAVPVPRKGWTKTSVHIARADYFQGMVYEELGRYQESLMLYERAQQANADAGNAYLEARCRLARGAALYQLKRYDEALNAYRQAHAVFVALDSKNYITMCQLNMALVAYDMGRYSEALALYHPLAEAAQAEGRLLRVARCYANMGLCYVHVGRYDQALIYQTRAQEAFREGGSILYAALLEVDLAATYRRLGRHAEALGHYGHARQTFEEQGTPVYLARCDMHLADLHLALGQYADALSCLQRARATCAEAGMPAQVAACDREIGRIEARLGQVATAAARLADACQAFRAAGLVVDAALCDLAFGELYLDIDEVGRAEPSLDAARVVLEPGFPDEAWRCAYGLGRCALRMGKTDVALERWLAAVHLTDQTRAQLPTERLSGGFFADRRPLYEATLRLALQLGAAEAALGVAEASKAQSFFVSVEQPRWADVARANPHLAGVLKREAALRQEMEALRQELRLVEMAETGLVWRGGEELRDDQPETLARLAALGQEYEAVVERLRLEAPGSTPNPTPAPFSVPALRAAASGTLPPHWACLAYYLLDDALAVFYLDAERLSVVVHDLTKYDRLALRQCTETASDFRELVYRGTQLGRPAPGNVGQNHLGHLYQVLVPPELRGREDLACVIISPHAALHGLPFHALLDDGCPFIDQTSVSYVPSLGALQWRLSRRREAPAVEGAASRILVCGVSDFGADAPALPHVSDEIATLRDIWGRQADILWGAAATPAALQRLSEGGELEHYDVIHFAAHAVLDRGAPSQSRILLTHGSLTFADILNLRLRARLVVLSACEGATGEQYGGDEVMALARAFLLAGVQIVVASLWPVDDTAASEFIGRFYRQFKTAPTVAEALRAAQIEMTDEGYPAFDWAPFIAVGV